MMMINDGENDKLQPQTQTHPSHTRKKGYFDLY